MINTYNFIVLDHARKTVTLNLQHVFNFQCKGCKADLAEAKEVAKQLGYRFILNEPSKEPESTLPSMTLITVSNKGKIRFQS